MRPGTAHWFRNEFDEEAHFRVEVRPPPPVVPLAAQKRLFGVLAPLGRALGYRSVFPEYLARSAEPLAHG